MYTIFSMHYVTPFVQKRDVEDDLFYIHPIVIIYSTFSDGNLLKMGRRHEKKSYTSHNAYFTSKSGLKQDSNLIGKESVNERQVKQMEAMFPSWMNNRCIPK